MRLTGIINNLVKKSLYFLMPIGPPYIENKSKNFKNIYLLKNYLFENYQQNGKICRVSQIN